MRLYLLLAFVISALIAGSDRLRGATDSTDGSWRAPARAVRKKNPVPANESSIAAGRKTYFEQCVDCHGSAGRGDGRCAKDLEPPPEDLAGPAVVEQSDGALFWKISEGRAPMPAFEKLMSEEDRWNVINYVRTLTATSNH
jgi:mono/diheme cytochrome c family protein